MKNRGFTLVELLLIFGLLVTGIILIAQCLQRTGFKGQKNFAERESEKWAYELGLQVQGVSCVQADTNHDGYVACTLTTTDGKIHALRCSTALSLNKGCKLRTDVHP